MFWIVAFALVMLIFMIIVCPDLLCIPFVVAMWFLEALFHVMEAIAGMILITIVRMAMLISWLTERFFKLDRRVTSSIGGALLLVLIALAAAVFG